jgi:pyrrolysine biosynthesis protein PylC
MIKVAIVGGKLQGTEAVYLAKKAGMKSLLIDHNDQSPAAGLCDEFLCCDVTRESRELIDALNGVDFILPANENTVVLEALVKLSDKYRYTLAFDKDAYAITSSKLLSDRLIHENRIPAPRYYPDCHAPYIAKPSGFSGSEGVRRFDTEEELKRFLQTVPADEWVIQEFLEGPSYSIEVIGKPGDYKIYEITEIHMDEAYDCKKVTAPCAVTDEQKEGFRRTAVRLAELVRLKGIMDVEVIDDRGEFKVLEIDARIPSQTPTVVYHAAGVNFMEELAELFCNGRLAAKMTARETCGAGQTIHEPEGGTRRAEQAACKRFCSYEHFIVKNGRVTEHGEHIMSADGRLTLRGNFFGADEVISDYAGEGLPWRGTFINSADTAEELARKRENMRKCLIDGRR